MVSVEEIEKIAGVARIAVDRQELEKTVGSFSQILEFVGELSEVDTSGVEATTCLTAGGVLREDVAGVEFSQEEALSNAPCAKKGHFAIPKVIG